MRHNYKTLAAILLLYLAWSLAATLPPSARAQMTGQAHSAPRTLSYQGVLSNTGGTKASGPHVLTVTLYGDANGTTKLWQGTMNTQVDSFGVFNTMLGTDTNPLPEPAVMDRPIWLGVAVDNGPELRPLSEMTASAYALNVVDNAITTPKLADGAVTTAKLADSSITWRKMATDYVPYIRVNGTKVNTGNRSINFTGGEGLRVDFDSSTLSVIIGTDSSSSAVIGSGKGSKAMGTDGDWTLTGNGGTTPGTNFVGTSDNEALWFKVNATTSMRFEPTVGEPNILGGSSSNSISGVSSVIAGGGNSSYANSITADYSVIGGGYKNQITSNDTASVIGGGGTNTINGLYGFIGGGRGNTVSQGNDGDDFYSVVTGGLNNFADEGYEFIGGGNRNQIFGQYYGVIAGGDTNEIDGNYGSIIGGWKNIIASTSNYGTIGGGDTNYIYLPWASILGGSHNYTFDTADAIVGGTYNTTGYSSGYAFIGGGFGNYAGGSHSAIAGGDTNVIAAGADYSFIGSGRANVIQGPWCAIAGGDSNNIFAEQADHNVITGGLHNIEQNPSFGSIGGGGYNLLDTAAWGSTIAGGWEDTVRSAVSTIAGGQQNSIYTGEWTYGAFIGGGRWNRMGNGVDAVLTGGNSNTTFGARSALVGGQMNRINAESAFLGGGDTNVVDWGSDTSAIVGGFRNYIAGSKYSFVGGGQSNVINGTVSDHNVIAGGENDTVSSEFDFIGGGRRNRIFDSFSTIGGGENNVIFDFFGLVAHSFIGGGHNNAITSDFSTIGGGTSNVIDVPSNSFNNNVLTGGLQNFIGGNTSEGTIGGGFNDTLRDEFGTIGGGNTNSITSTAPTATIPGGDHLIAQSYAQTVMGYFNSPAGSATDTASAKGSDDPLVIVGNGGNVGGKTVRSNAATISYDGHVSAYDQNGSGGATPTSPTIRSSFAGTLYEDNNIYAWADVQAGPPPGPGIIAPANSDFGVSSIVHPVNGEYDVTLNIKKPDGSAYTLIAGAVTVTVEAASANGCYFATATPLSGNTFKIFIHDTQCSDGNDINQPFMFHVTGR